MIFVTVGSQLAFDRMTQAVLAWARARQRTDLFFQTGASSVDCSGFAASAMLSAQEIRARFDEATVVVAHAGTGTIIECMLRGTPIIVLPRSAKLQETRNDHQFGTARRFQSRQGVFVAWNEEELAALLDRADSLVGGASIAPHADEQLLSALRRFVAEKRAGR